MNSSQFPSYASLSQDPLFRYALLAALILHLLLLFTAWLQPSLPKSKPTPKAVVVNTVKLSPPAASATPTLKSSSSSAPAAKVEEKKPPIPKDPPKVEARPAALPEVKPSPSKPAPPAKVEPKATAAPKSTSTPKPAPKKEATKKPATKESVKENKPTNPVPAAKPAASLKPVEKPAPKSPPPPARQTGPNPALLAEAKEALSAIKKTETAPLSKPSASADSLLKTASPTLLSLESLGSSQQQLSVHECSYCEELAGRLKLFLRLPAYGEVKLRLTLKRNGLVAKVEILSSVNGDNRHYVEKSLPELQFTPFGQNFAGEEQHSFLLTLTNE